MRGVEMGQRLVEQGDARRLHRQLRQPRALALAAGQGGERARGEIGQFPGGEVRRQIRGGAEGVMAERDEIGHAAEEPAFVALRQEADVLRADERRQRVERVAVELDLALGGRGKSRQHRQQRRLAGAVGAEDAEYFAGFEREVERIDQSAGAGVKGEVLGGQAHGLVGSEGLRGGKRSGTQLFDGPLARRVMPLLGSRHQSLWQFVRNGHAHCEDMKDKYAHQPLP